MRRNQSIGPSLSASETLWGIGYLMVQLFVLPQLLLLANTQLSNPLTEAEINFTLFLLNFMAMLVIFHDFLGKSAHQALQHPIALCQAVVLGLAAYYASTFLAMNLVTLLDPGYTNYNDAAIQTMGRSSSFLMLIGTVVLVPPFEECMFRGLVFRNLYSKNRAAAYCVSILLFAAIHIMGYIGQYSPLGIAMACLQYLPAGLCLAWSYAKAETIFAPIFVHAIINYLSICSLR